MQITPQIAGVAGGAAFIGSVAGFVVSSKFHSKRFNERLEHELEAAREFYAKLYDEPDATPPAEEPAEPPIVETAMRIFEARSPAIKVPDEVVAVVENHFDEPVDILKAARADEVAEQKSIHLLTEDEFNLNETDYEQISLTFFEGDGVLVDVNDEPITNADKVVGKYNLGRFGYGTTDENVVYIRNLNLESDFEVTRSRGKFVDEVLGYGSP